MKMLPPVEMAALREQLAKLPELSRDDLMGLWTKLFEKAPPSNTSRGLLTLAVGYKLQKNARGGLKPSVLRRLFQMADGIDKPSPAKSLTPGTLLVREWQGVTHNVTVLEEGLLYQAKVYRSLTQVARLITGTHQSGFIFFGLRKARRE